VLPNCELTSVINCIRRLVARRGDVRTIVSDRGLNFVGAAAQIKKTQDEFNRNLAVELQREGIEWKFAPAASSEKMGTVERMIGSFRRALFHVLKGQTLTDDGLLTVIVECENIINSRPLIPTSEDPIAEVLTPNHLLLCKGETLPLQRFDAADCFARNRWKQVQFCVQQFWERFYLEYATHLHLRTKWMRPRRSFRVGDFVLIEAKNAPRKEWQTGVVVDIKKGEDGFVRTVNVRTKAGDVLRSCQRICLLEGVED